MFLGMKKPTEKTKKNTIFFFDFGINFQMTLFQLIIVQLQKFKNLVRGDCLNFTLVV